MELSDYLPESNVCFLDLDKKEDVLLKMIDMAISLGHFNDVKTLQQEVFYREKLMSTGIGLGIAIPHVRLDQVKTPAILAAVCKKGIQDYQTIDDRLVKIVFLVIVGKDQQKEYLTLISQIVSKFKETQKNELLVEAQTQKSFLELFLA